MSIQKINKCTSVEHIAFSPAFANIMLGAFIIMCLEFFNIYTQRKDGMFDDNAWGFDFIRVSNGKYDKSFLGFYYDKFRDNFHFSFLFFEFSF
jgi:hypothetical protein